MNNLYLFLYIFAYHLATSGVPPVVRVPPVENRCSIRFSINCNNIISSNQHNRLIKMTALLHSVLKGSCYIQHFVISILPSGNPKSAWPISIFYSVFYPHQTANQQISILTPAGYGPGGSQGWSWGWRTGRKIHVYGLLYLNMYR